MGRTGAKDIDEIAFIVVRADCAVFQPLTLDFSW